MHRANIKYRSVCEVVDDAVEISIGILQSGDVTWRCWVETGSCRPSLPCLAAASHFWG